jgi:hypothetical protein
MERYTQDLQTGVLTLQYTMQIRLILFLSMGMKTLRYKQIKKKQHMAWEKGSSYVVNLFKFGTGTSFLLFKPVL